MTTSVTQSLDQLCINTIRTLAMDAVQKANSGHPGTPMAPGAAGLRALCTRHLRHDPRRSALVEPRPLRAVGRPRLDAALRAAPPHRLRPAARRAEAVPPVGQPDAGPPRVRVTPGVETTTGPLGPGRRQRRRHGDRRGAPGGARSTAPATTIIDHHTYVICQRRRHDGRRLARGRVARRPPRARQAHLLLRRQPHHHRRRHRRSRSARTSAQRFEAYGWHVQRVARRQRPRRDRRGARRPRRPRPTGPSLIVVRTPHRLRQPAQGRTPPRRTASRSAPRRSGDQAEARLARRRAVLRARRRAAPTWRKAGERGAAAAGGVAAAASTRTARRIPTLAARAGRRRCAASCRPAGTPTIPTFPPDEGRWPPASASGKVLNAHRRGASRADRRLGRPRRPRTKTLDRRTAATSTRRRLRRPQHALRHPRARDGRDAERHGAPRRHPARTARTFLIFSDYMRPPIRLAALMEQPRRSTSAPTTRSAWARTARPTSRSSSSRRCARSRT